MMKKEMISLLLIVGLMSCLSACQNETAVEEKPMDKTPVPTPVIQTYNSTYKVVAGAFDWGAASTKAIIELNGQIGETDVCGFQVTEANCKGNVGEREVTSVYLCDENGNETAGDSSYIAVEMSADPSHGTLLYYDRSRYYNIWDEDYRLSFSPIDPQNEILKNLSVDPAYTERITPQADKFTQSQFEYNKITMAYALFTPNSNNEKKPLVVWLHGQGEGGDDVTVTLYGNKLTALADKEIQDILGGACVLVPQCPTYWPEKTAESQSFGLNVDGTSYWKEPLKALIDEVVAANNIDADRIYIGGCSMGGYMTMLMAKNYPDFFAAVFPVCEYYERFIDEEGLKALAEVPLWFTYCTEDRTVPPDMHSAVTMNRLKEAGALNVHASIFNDVHDTTGEYSNEDGTPFIYDSHWVWIYVLNNECKDGDLDLWEWLAAQHR